MKTILEQISDLRENGAKLIYIVIVVDGVQIPVENIDLSITDSMKIANIYMGVVQAVNKDKFILTPYGAINTTSVQHITFAQGNKEEDEAEKDNNK